MSAESTIIYPPNVFKAIASLRAKDKASPIRGLELAIGEDEDGASGSPVLFATNGYVLAWVVRGEMSGGEARETALDALRGQCVTLDGGSVDKALTLAKKDNVVVNVRGDGVVLEVGSVPIDATTAPAYPQLSNLLGVEGDRPHSTEDVGMSVQRWVEIGAAVKAMGFSESVVRWHGQSKDGAMSSVWWSSVGKGWTMGGIVMPVKGAGGW